MPFQIVRNDITRITADAIVNTANPRPCFGGGTDTAVYKAAGEKELLEARKKIGRIAPGEAVVTGAFRLSAKYIIHTAGPAWTGGNHHEFDILRSCYRKSLLLADQLGCSSVAFPLIAAGVNGFPRDKALETALDVIKGYLSESDMQVTLVVFDKAAFQTASELTRRIEEYIDENYVSRQIREEYREPAVSMLWKRKPLLEETAHTGNKDYKEGDFYVPENIALEDAVRNLGESFQTRLFRMIAASGLTDAEVYKRANIDRKLFSKIRCSEDYIPRKRTILALAVALHLNQEETKDLLASAGYALANNNKADVIICFCLENNIFDIFEVNTLLFRFGQPLLG